MTFFMVLKTVSTHLGFDVFSCQTLSDDVDAFWVSQDMGSALRTVHQGLDAADQRRVDLGFDRLVVHGLEEVKDAGEAILLQEARHKTAEGQGKQLI